MRRLFLVPDKKKHVNSRYLSRKDEDGKAFRVIVE